MPNGGSDCCATCPFNEKNEGEGGFEVLRKPGRDYCTIRDLEIEPSAYYTYCVNHPHHNPDGIDVPVGAVYKGDGLMQRRVWVEATDTPAARQRAVGYVSRLEYRWHEQYPFGTDFDTEIVLQLGRWREHDALPALRALATRPLPPPPPGYEALDDLHRAVIASPAALQEVIRRVITEIEGDE